MGEGVIVSAHASLSHPSRHFGAFYWCLILTSLAVLSLRYAPCVCLSVELQQSVSQQ